MSAEIATQSIGDSRPDGKNEIRQRLQGMWASVADAWREHADYVDERAGPITRRLIELANPGVGDRVLELACGPGGVGLEIAPIVGPAGEVVLSDVAVGMTDIAIARAKARDLANISGRVLDLESITEPDRSYDVVVCREGLMFALDPSVALGEMRRVLRPGGRLALSVWGPRIDNPWLGLIFDVASEVMGRPVPPTGIPGPFSLGEPDKLAGILAGGGLVDLAFEEVPVITRTPSFETFWSRTSALAGPLTKILAGMPAPAREALKERLKDVLRPYAGDAGLELPGVALIAAGKRPEV